MAKKKKDLRTLANKYKLICSDEYQEIRKLQLDHILSLVNSSIEPLVIKGMLKTITDTDKWEAEFRAEKDKEEIEE